ncbi:hypothetical protein AB205_0010350 [Aquarana catesbeiana]|uniref:Uncharacterized protein n=1 Tax=Aquarana catesbeiana TaxID=8400 RepID=A0A2G9Q609_AQUCT|nr:hypothetical protein AB205_0010350 [Aquarana catesbeiana]
MKKWKSPKPNQRRRRETTTTGDRDVVEEGNFTSESAQILIGEIMGYNRDLENINDVQTKMKNIIDVLGRI